MLPRPRGARPDSLSVVGIGVDTERGGVVLGGYTQYRALITGVSGQDGWYLAERLLEQGCDAHGIVRDPVGRGAAPG